MRDIRNRKAAFSHHRGHREHRGKLFYFSVSSVVYTHNCSDGSEDNYGENAVIGNPRFTDISAGDFTLRSSSLCFDVTRVRCVPARTTAFFQGPLARGWISEVRDSEIILKLAFPEKIFTVSPWSGYSR